MTIDYRLLVNLFFSFLDFAGLTLLALSVYRIPIIMYWKRLLAIQLVLLGVMVVYDHFLQSKDFYALTIASVGIILLTVLLKIPVLYSALIWVTGYSLAVLIQMILVVIVTGVGLFNLEQLQSSEILSNVAIAITFATILLIVYYMHKKRLGFMFIMNRFRLEKRSLRAKDFFVATFFICIVALIQAAINSYFTNELNHYLFIVLVGMIIISVIGLYVTYLFNIREIDERFNMIRKKK